MTPIYTGNTGFLANKKSAQGHVVAKGLTARHKVPE